MGKEDATAPKARLQRAITYWLEHDPVPTREEIRRVAKKFTVRWEDLETALKLRTQIEAKKRSVHK